MSHTCDYLTTPHGSILIAHSDVFCCRYCGHQVAKERGIGFQIVRIWPGDRTLECQLKNQKNAPKLCPICRVAHKVPVGQLTLDLEDDLL
jgi:hypothetical protein